ncbi:flagellar motor protein MotB [Symbiobacterium thermophilum]|uniref:Flagellar motor protein MotB n=1 Tax=Symbiobacterium thermophilum (strain DSM 24528 / JCM 14929 / IAM 14863 / T) TaxID=292459 RepID=Q67K43_SYMTH|nr:flagellar motor protein MotB [Symbiobacterium thermophilum]BAD41955.1 flagellar motor protein MotB [Symbiobacterium thermophilum IAM 14863]
MAAMNKKPSAAEEHGGGGHGSGTARWMVSYADFMTLMFIVFVVMFSFARVDTAKYQSLARSLGQALGTVGPDIAPLPTRGQEGTALPIIWPERPGSLPDVPDWPAHLIAPPEEEPTESAPVPPVEPPPAEAEPADEPTDVWTVLEPEPAPVPASPRVTAPVAEPDEMAEVAEVFRAMPGVKTGLLSVALEERGIVLSVAGSLLFEPGEYTIRPEAYPTLNEIADKLAGVELPIMVNGTADASHAAGSAEAFELAALRAGAVVRYFTETYGLPGGNFVYFGYGDGQSASDRVTIVVARKAR